jgi:hypothetical protein
VPPAPAPEDEHEGEQEQQRRRDRHGGGDAGEEGAAEAVVVVPGGQGRRRERLLEEKAGRHGWQWDGGTARAAVVAWAREAGGAAWYRLRCENLMGSVYSTLSRAASDILDRVRTSSSRLTIRKRERLIQTIS